MLPEVPYTPLVFTIPKILRPALLFRPKVYSVFCRAACLVAGRQAYRVVCLAFEAPLPELDQPVVAFLASSQSFGTLLEPPLHVHALSSCGVFDREGVVHPADDFDFAALELHFRDAMLVALERQDAIDEERANLISAREHPGFGVHTERIREPACRRELESILQYMERTAVSLKRLTLLDTGMVHYQGHYHPGLGRYARCYASCNSHALVGPVFARGGGKSGHVPAAPHVQVTGGAWSWHGRQRVQRLP